MPVYQGIRPKIVWNGNTITFGTPLLNPIAYSKPRDGSKWVTSPSGAEDAYILGTDQLLQGVVPWIPRNDAARPKPATGWNGATGWRAFLEWARQKNTFTFYPDAAGATTYTCYLLNPITDPPELEVDLTRRITLLLRTSDDTPFDGY